MKNFLPESLSQKSGCALYMAKYSILELKTYHILRIEGKAGYSWDSNLCPRRSSRGNILGLGAKVHREKNKEGKDKKLGGSSQENEHANKKKNERKNNQPWLVWLSGLNVCLLTERSLVRFPVRAHAWLTSQVPHWGRARSSQSTSVFLSLSFLYLHSKNKQTNK